jgi:hypothetical protein
MSFIKQHFMRDIITVNTSDDVDMDYRYIHWLNERKDVAKEAFPFGCNLCSGDVILVDSIIIYGKSYGNIYYCLKCGNYVGVHKETDKPLGLIADENTRKARIKAHGVFDNFFKSKIVTRKNSYKILQALMNMSADDAHISRFDTQQCGELVSQIKRLKNMLNSIII